MRRRKFIQSLAVAPVVPALAQQTAAPGPPAPQSAAPAGPAGAFRGGQAVPTLETLTSSDLVALPAAPTFFSALQFATLRKLGSLLSSPRRPPRRPRNRCARVSRWADQRLSRRPPEALSRRPRRPQCARQETVRQILRRARYRPGRRHPPSAHDRHSLGRRYAQRSRASLHRAGPPRLSHRGSKLPRMGFRQCFLRTPRTRLRRRRRPLLATHRSGERLIPWPQKNTMS